MATGDYYMGRPLDELTREELIEAVLHLDSLLRQESSEHMRQLDFLAGNTNPLATRPKPNLTPGGQNPLCVSHRP